MENGSKLLIDTSILYRSMQKFYDKRLSAYELGSGQLPLLLLIYEHEGISMQQLAKLGSFDKGTITRGLVKLEEQGYIRIKTNRNDKRVRQLYTCEKTKDIISKAYMIRREWWEQATKELDASQIALFEELQHRIANRARDMEMEEDRHMRIFGMQKLTLLDFPGKVACTLFSGGCNFRCPYCQNSDLVFLSEDLIEIDRMDIERFLEKRKGLLEGVCISGGEPLLQEGIEDVLIRIRQMGYAIKLDTNGSKPKKLKELIDKQLIDYVAMDVKNDPAHYGETIGVPDFDLSGIMESVEVLKQGRIPYEFRTTVVKEFHNEERLEALAQWLKGGSAYYLQPFVDSEKTISKGLHSHDAQDLQAFQVICNAYIPTKIRGR